MEQDELKAPELVIAENLLKRLREVQKFKLQTAKRIMEQTLILSDVADDQREYEPETFIHNVDFMIRITVINQKITQYEKLDRIEQELLRILGEDDA